jgi:hypothetical protein
MTLAEKLGEIRAGARQNIPSQVAAEMERATEELAASGIRNRALNVGADIPGFGLPNIAGEQTSVESMFRPEGLVITFYRGLW